MGLCQGEGLLRLIEKFRPKNKSLFVFVDLEKDFDRVLSEIICFAEVDVPEYLVDGVVSL